MSKLDDARRLLFQASRELSAAHASRFGTCKCGQCNPQVVHAARLADRNLQRAAVSFVAELASSIPGPPETIAEIIATLTAAIVDPPEPAPVPTRQETRRTNHRVMHPGFYGGIADAPFEPKEPK